MSKICLIRQQGGAGDIFFCQKIGYHYHTLGYKVIWPVVKVYNYIKDYIHNFEYPCVDEPFPYKDLFFDKENTKEIVQRQDLILVPLHEHNLRSPSVMYSKYNLVGLSFNDWDKYFNFTRNTNKENELFELLNLKENEEYTLFNNTFASPPGILIKNIPLDNYKDTRIVNLSMIDEFTLFDWCKVIENATNILTVDTSINYIIDKLNVKARNLELYSRYTPENYSQIKGIFKTKWRYNRG